MNMVSLKMRNTLKQLECDGVRVLNVEGQKKIVFCNLKIDHDKLHRGKFQMMNHQMWFDIQWKEYWNMNQGEII